MSRPKRAAAQKTLTKETTPDKGDLDLSEESDDGDFSSASSDEYDPNKDADMGRHEETFEESEESESEEVEDESSFADSPVKQR